MTPLACPFCSQPVQAFTVRTKQRPYHRCVSCGYVFLDPSRRLPPALEKKRYCLHQNDLKDPGYRRWLDQFLSFVDKVCPGEPGPVLDFGCGPSPGLVELFKKRGLMVQGEDPFFFPRRRQGPFSLITALEVFEHLAHPRAVFEDLDQRLLPGGTLVISTEFLPPAPRDFASWPYRFDATHVSFYEERTLRFLGRERGWRFLESDGIRRLAFAKPSLDYS